MALRTQVRLSSETSETSSSSRWKALGALCAFTPGSSCSVRSESSQAEASAGVNGGARDGSSSYARDETALAPDVRRPSPLDSAVLPRPINCAPGEQLPRKKPYRYAHRDTPLPLHAFLHVLHAVTHAVTHAVSYDVSRAVTHTHITGKLLYEEPSLLPSLRTQLGTTPAHGGSCAVGGPGTNASSDARDYRQAQRASRRGTGLPASMCLPAPEGHALAAAGGCRDIAQPHAEEQQGVRRRHQVGVWMSVVNEVAVPLQTAPQQTELKRKGRVAPHRIAI